MYSSYHKIIALFFVMCAALIVLHCTEEEQELEATLVGAADIVTGGAQYFKAQIDTELTSNCGTAAAVSSTSTTTESVSSNDSSSTDVSKYSIVSYIQFQTGQTMLLKFTYDEEDDNFRLTPTTTNVQTCPTLDNISCNGTSGVNPTCETTDNVTCGGITAFIFTSTLPVISFVGSTGTIDYNNGFSLDTDTGKVDNFNLEFNLIATNGSVFSGNIYCSGG